MKSGYPLHQRKKTSTLSSASFFFRRSLTRKDSRGEDDTKGLKGAIGLTTLYDPGQDAIADLIFVHGLNGGSQSTWTKNGDPSLFWLREWLPKDEAFQDVRIHTFGYASGLSRESVLNVPDFAKSLLGSIHDSPSIPRGKDVPMILVGHSMGGLVVKKAFILGSQISEFASLVRNIFAIFFLATPHQGAGLADTLGRILALAPGSRPFVHDLSPESPVLQSINEEFPRYCNSLELFSYFENKPMRLGIRSQLIVEKHCAVMNYSNERSTYLDANHRDVARFSHRNDPSYLTIRNALATTIASKRSLKESSRQKVGFEQIETLNTFLGISNAPDDDVIGQDSIRLPRTCDWFLEKDGFKQWRDASISKTLWLCGRPGAGKSVLSAHIVSHLREQGYDCCFYFFVQGDKTKATINSFLRSMLWQMAMLHPAILAVTLDIAANWQATALNKVDHVPVWRRLYLGGILKTRLNRPQYWIIDALDECKGGSELMAFLIKMQELWPVCLLVTSRDPIDKYANSANPRVEVISETIEGDTNRDIALFLEASQDLLPATGVSEREAMTKQILQSANGCFLWVTLVLKELRQAHTSTEIQKVLSTNTDDMDELYARILNDMANAKFGKELAKAILTWSTFSFRPLSTEEMRCAIEIHINDTVKDFERSISTCCGNLVYVDSHKKVQLLHLTVRDFLTRQSMKHEFMIDCATAHKQLAIVCLRCLVSNEMRTFQPRKLSVPQLQEEPQLADYACKHVFQHLLHVKSNDGEILAALSEFMGSRFVLSWIERLATEGDLQRVFQAGKTINNLLNGLTQHSPLIGLRKELKVLESWGNDLVHLVTKFGKELSFSPSAIHHLIPPFCPVDSAPNRQFSSPHRGLSIYGQTTEGWDDCLSILNFPKPSRPLTVAISQKSFSVGMSTGEVIIYNDFTCQESNSLEHREPVWALAFSDNGSMCASAGAKTICVWDLGNWSKLFHFSIPCMCLSLTFAEENLLLFAAMKSNEIMCWNIVTGDILHEMPTNWTIYFDERSVLRHRQPTLASFSPQQNLLAVVYRGEDILLWDFEQDQIYDIYEKETGSRLHGSTKVSDGSTTVWCLVFSAAGDSMLLIAAYSDGDLVVYDTMDGAVKHIVTGVNAQRISCSPDGRTLACADSQGTIQLFDLESMKLLYRLEFDGDAISPRALAFTSDSHRIIDIRANQCRLWDPIVLLRQDMDDENNDTISISSAPHEVNFQGSTSVHITAIESIASASVVFCGKEDGSVHVYDISLKPQSTELFVQTPGVPVILLHFDAENAILTCSDAASRVTSRQVRRKQRNNWDTYDPLIDTTIGEGITAILASGRHSRLLVSTDSQNILWSMPKDSREEALIIKKTDDKGHWIGHGSNHDALILVSTAHASIYQWRTLEHIHTVSLAELTEPFTAIRNVIPLHHSRYFAAIAIDPSRTKSSQHVIQIFDFGDFTNESQTAKCVHNLGTLSSVIDTVIGVFNERLVFLDANNWICSTGIVSTQTPHVRHFFIPSDWVSLVKGPMLDLARNGDIIFVKRAELFVIKRGLDMAEKGKFTPRKNWRVSMEDRE